MPAIRIDTRQGWIGARRQAVIAAVERAVVAGVNITEGMSSIVLMEHAPDAMAAPRGKGAAYLVVEVRLLAGRSNEARKRLFAAMAEQLAPLGVASADIEVVLIDVPRESWGLDGRPASEIALDFKVDV